MVGKCRSSIGEFIILRRSTGDRFDDVSTFIEAQKLRINDSTDRHLE